MTAVALAVIHIGINPVFFHLGGFSLHWYGVAYAAAFTAAYWYGVRPYLERHGIPRGDSESLLLWVILAGLIGARLYYDVQTDFADKLRHPIELIAAWEGGMAFFGAMLGSILAILVISRRRGYSFWLLLDAGALFAVIGQPIGRLGNIVNGDILGGPSNLPWATAYTYVVNGDPLNPQCAVLQPGHFCGVAYQPAAAYEAIGTIVIGLLLYAMLRRGARVGVIGVVYVALYAISQLVVFVFRTEPTYAGLKQAQWTALVVLLVAFPLLVVLQRRSRDPVLAEMALPRTVGGGAAETTAEPGGGTDATAAPGDGDEEAATGGRDAVSEDGAGDAPAPTASGEDGAIEEPAASGRLPD